MSPKYLEEDKKEYSEVLTDTHEVCSEKKPLRDVLSSYMKKSSVDERGMKKMKKELSNIKHNMKNAKNSFETLMDIQKKLSQAYNNLSENEQKKVEEPN